MGEVEDEDRPMDVSVVIPCLNESATLPVCIGEARSLLEDVRARWDLSGEVVVADNGSSDDSRAVAVHCGARVVRVHEKGYGSALRGGIAAARGRYIVMADGDGSYDFREAVAMIDHLRAGTELCMGDRFSGKIMPGAMPWKNRHIGNPLLSGILNLLFRSGLRDAHCGLRAFTKAAFDRMCLSAKGMEFASEMVIKATLLGLLRAEVPVTLRPDLRDRPPHLRPWRDGWRHLRYLFMLSPGWLFFIPSAISALLGTLVYALLLLNTGTEVVRIGPIWFGDHWAIVAGGLMIIAHQAALFGLVTSLFGIRSGYRQPTEQMCRLFRAARLEHMLVAGALLICLGVLVFLATTFSWSLTGFRFS